MDFYPTASQSASANFHRPHMSTSVQDQRTWNVKDPRSCWQSPGDLSTDATGPLDYDDISPTSTFNERTPLMESHGLHMLPECLAQDQLTNNFSAQATTSVDVQGSLDGLLLLTDTSIFSNLPSTEERLEGSPWSFQASNSPRQIQMESQHYNPEPQDHRNPHGPQDAAMMIQDGVFDIVSSSASSFTATEQGHGTSSNYPLAAECPTGTELLDASELQAASCHVNAFSALAASNFNRIWMETLRQIQMEPQHYNPRPQDHMNPHGPQDAAISVNLSHRVSYPMSRTSNSSYNSYSLSTDSGEQHRLGSLASPVTFSTSRRSSIAEAENLPGEANIAVLHEGVAIHPGHGPLRACVPPEDSSHSAMRWTVASG